MKPLIWLRMPEGRWRIDWRRMRAIPTGKAPVVFAQREDRTTVQSSNALSRAQGEEGLSAMPNDAFPLQNH